MRAGPPKLTEWEIARHAVASIARLVLALSVLGAGLAIALLLVFIVAAHAEDRKCIREMHKLYGDMTTAKRQCDPKNFVTDPNEYGWYRLAPECKPERIKGEGAKQPKDAACE